MHCTVLCLFIAKKYLWPVTGTVRLNRRMGAEDVKRMGVENLAGGSTPLTPSPSTRTLHCTDGLCYSTITKCTYTCRVVQKK